MLAIRQRAVDFDQARREANAAAALLEMEGGTTASATFDDADGKIDDAGGKKLGAGLGGLGDLDALNKETGLRDCESLGTYWRLCAH